MPPIKVTPNDAEAERSMMQREHNAFIGRLQGFSDTWSRAMTEDIGMSFTKTMKDLYSSSSKKHISRE